MGILDGIVNRILDRQEMKRALGHTVSCSAIEIHGFDPAHDSTLPHSGHHD